SEYQLLPEQYQASHHYSYRLPMFLSQVQTCRDDCLPVELVYAPSMFYHHHSHFQTTHYRERCRYVRCCSSHHNHKERHHRGYHLLFVCNPSSERCLPEFYTML